jgi:membrane-associated phospholipid phosphatase
VCLFALFLTLAYLVQTGSVRGEARLDLALKQQSPRAFVWLSNGVSAPVWDALAILATVALWLVGQRRRAVALICGLLAAELLTAFAKDAINRQAPGTTAVAEFLLRAPYVLFPSAHVVRATVALVILVTALGERSRSVQAAAWGGVLVFLGLLGLTQVSVGGHLPLDVLGGYFFGGACAAIALLVARLHPFSAGSSRRGYSAGGSVEG